MYWGGVSLEGNQTGVAQVGRLEPHEDFEVGSVVKDVLLLPLSWAHRTPYPLTLNTPSPGLFLLSSVLGLEQLKNLRHLDVAYNLLEGHTELAPLWLLAELRKVRPSA